MNNDDTPGITLNPPIIDNTTVSDISGGDIILHPGKGWSPNSNTKLFNGSIIFQDANGEEFIRIGPHRQIFVEGKLCSDNSEFVHYFNLWVVEMLTRGIINE